jgi:hypothetical protein
VHQYYSLTILEDEAKKSKESLEAMLENMIFEKWNASQWPIVGFERPIDDELPESEDPLKRLVTPLLDSATISGGRLTASPAIVRAFAGSNTMLLARLNSVAEAFNKNMSEDGFTLTVAAAKRLKTLPTVVDPLPIALPAAPAMPVTIMKTEDLKDLLGTWKISPVLTGYMCLDGSMGISANRKVEVSPLSICFAKMGKGLGSKMSTPTPNNKARVRLYWQVVRFRDLQQYSVVALQVYTMLSSAMYGQFIYTRCVYTNDRKLLSKSPCTPEVPRQNTAVLRGSGALSQYNHTETLSSGVTVVILIPKDLSNGRTSSSPLIARSRTT